MLAVKNEMIKSEPLQSEYLRKNKLDSPYNNWVTPKLRENPVLALCETEAEVDYFSQTKAPKIDMIIALTPQAAARCYLADTPYLKIEDFFDVSAFWYGDEPMLTLQRHWADSVDNFLWDIYPPWSELRFQPTNAMFFFLKVLIDGLFKTVFGLSHLFIASRPEQVYYFADQAINDTIDETLFFKDSIYRRVLPLCAAEYDVSIEELHAIGKDSFTLEPSNGICQNALKGRFLSLLPQKFADRLYRAKHCGPGSFFKANHHDNGPTLLYQPGYDISIAAKYAQKMGFRLQTFNEILPPSSKYNWETSGITPSPVEAWKQICQSSYFREPFYWCGVDMFGIAESRLKYWWYTLIPTIWLMFQQALKRFEKTLPNIVMVYTPWSLQHHAVFQAARSLAIPTVTYQHGGFEGSCEYIIYDATDLRQSDYRLVYGESIAAYLQERKARNDGALAEIIPVGSTRLDTLRATINGEQDRSRIRRQLHIADSEILISYLPTSYQYYWYMARQAYLGVPYLEMLIQVINVLREFPELQFVYKSFPEYPPDPMSKIVAARCPNCRFISDMPMTLLLQASDAFIFDMPSTGLLEAFLTAKPILLHSDQRFIALRPEARTMLKKRVILSETPNDFIKQLRLFLGKGEFKKMENPDCDLLRAYGTFKGDGNSVRYAVEALYDIIQGKFRK
jgi:hypothetical protein